MLIINKKILQNAPDENTFSSKYGEIRNLMELRSMLINRGKKFYNQHVNRKENHFADWVNNVFEDAELSQSLRESSSFRESIIKLDKKIKYLELWMDHNQDNELLYEYLTNGPFSMTKQMGVEPHEPQHHDFEGSFNVENATEFFYIHNKAIDLSDNKLDANLIDSSFINKKQGFFNRIFKRK